MKAAIKTLDDLLARCVEIGDCMEWTGSRQPTGTPSCKFGRQMTNAGRVAYTMHHGLELSAIKGLAVWAGCKNQLCIAPKHLKIGTRPQMLVWRGIEGLCKRSPATKARDVASRHARGVRFTPDEIKAIRIAETSHIDEAEKHNVHKSTIAYIRSGRLYRDTVKGASIFTMGAA